MLPTCTGRTTGPATTETVAVSAKQKEEDSFALAMQLVKDKQARQAAAAGSFNRVISAPESGASEPLEGGITRISSDGPQDR